MPERAPEPTRGPATSAPAADPTPTRVASTPAGSLLALQRRAGNAAVNALLAPPTHRPAPAADTIRRMLLPQAGRVIGDDQRSLQVERVDAADEERFDDVSAIDEALHEIIAARPAPVVGAGAEPLWLPARADSPAAELGMPGATTSARTAAAEDGVLPAAVAAVGGPPAAVAAVAVAEDDVDDVDVDDDGMPVRAARAGGAGPVEGPVRMAAAATARSSGAAAAASAQDAGAAGAAGAGADEAAAGGGDVGLRYDRSRVDNRDWAFWTAPAVHDDRTMIDQARCFYRGMTIDEFRALAGSGALPPLPAFGGIATNRPYSRGFVTNGSPECFIVEFETPRAGWLYEEFTSQGITLKAEGDGGTFGLGTAGTSSRAPGAAAAAAAAGAAAGESQALRLFNTFLATHLRWTVVDCRVPAGSFPEGARPSHAQLIKAVSARPVPRKVPAGQQPKQRPWAPAKAAAKGGGPVAGAAARAGAAGAGAAGAAAGGYKPKPKDLRAAAAAAKAAGKRAPGKDRRR